MARFRTKRIFRVLRFCVPALALLFMLVVRASRAEPPAAVVTASAPLPVPTATAHRTSPDTVTVGLYLQNVPDVDIHTNSFAAEFYLWFLWSGDVDPTLTFELTNVVNVTELTKIPIFIDASGASAPETLPDGRKLQQFHVYGRFGRPFPLGKYPFDNHELVISLEDARHSSDVLVHELDTKGTSIRPDLTIPGWKLGPMKSKVGRSQFATTFGDPRSGRADDTYSHVDFSVHIDRPVVGTISKYIVPIALIILITFGAFFCQPTDIDARLSLTITALISAVALQFTAATELPPTGSLLLLDKVYILSYVAILATTFLCIGANRYANTDRPEQAARLDKLGLWLVAGGYFASLAFFIVRAQ
jgi:hypothetical protein